MKNNSDPIEGFMPSNTTALENLHGFRPAELLKADVFGRVERGYCSDSSGKRIEVVRRDPTAARWWAGILAHYLAKREAFALTALHGCPGVPRLLSQDSGGLVRSWQPGNPMQKVRPKDTSYFAQAFRLVVRMHRHGVTHNDLAKEPNWLVTPDGLPAVVDFQLATVTRRRTWWFRLLAREDLRHLLKHKRTYCPEALTARERHLLNNPSLFARLWRATGKYAYHWITRGLLGWADREGAGDRWTSSSGRNHRRD